MSAGTVRGTRTGEGPVGPEQPSGSSLSRRTLGVPLFVGLCAVFTVALRLPYLTEPLVPDEAGLMIIAQHWSQGPFLYGDFFVGRGIMLVLLFVLGDVMGGALGLRILACIFAVLMVLGSGWVGHLLRGPAGARWAALVAASYSSTYAFSSEGMNERLVGAVFVVTCCGLVLRAVREPRRWLFAVGAGVMGTLPLLVVQSFAEGLLFATIVIIGSWRARTLAGADAVRLFVGGLVGGLLVLAALAVAIATTWLTWSQLWFQMVAYRAIANGIVGQDTGAPERRFQVLMLIALLTGVFVLAAGLVAGYPRVRRDRALYPVWWALVAMLGLWVLSMKAGGDWWADYLLQPMPALALGAAMLIPSDGRAGITLRAGVAIAVVSAVVATWMGIYKPLLGTPLNEAAVGHWIDDSAEPADTAFVTWGKANIVYSADRTSSYPYLWSLLTRTLDPDLEDLLTIMRGPDAPTWIVEWIDVNTWGLDDSGELAQIIEADYVLVGAPCDKPTYLLRSAQRTLAPLPDAAECGYQ